MAWFNHGAIIAALWITLMVFFILGGLAVPLVMRRLKAQGESLLSEKGVDFWFTARNSQPWQTVALSVAATSAGAWLLYTPAEAAYNGGWLALIGYCIAISLGPLFMAVYGPRMRQQCADGANVTDWIYDRFGPVVHIYACLAFVYYMFIYMTGQLKTMGDMTIKFTGAVGPACPGPFCTDYLAPEHGIIPVAVITMIYTSIGGLPSTIMTDQIQAIAIGIIVVIISIFVFTTVDNFSMPANLWTTRGFEMGLSLCFAVFSAEVFNLAFWQRVFMAKDDRALRIGMSVGASITMVLTFFFGVIGLLMRAAEETRLANGEPKQIFVPAFAIFQINTMNGANEAIRMLLFVLATCMITSTVDSFQIGISSVLSRYMQKNNIPYKQALIIGVAVTMLVNIPAVAFAWFSVNDVNEDFDGLAVKLTDLFSMADIVTITLVVPILSGLWNFTTRWGCILGLASGVGTILTWGWAEFGTFSAGFEMVTMMCFGVTPDKQEADPNGDAYPHCGFYSKRSPMLFMTILVVTFVVTMSVSWMDKVQEHLSKLTGNVDMTPRISLGKVTTCIPTTRIPI